MKKRWLSVAILLAFSLMLMSCGKASSQAEPDKGTESPAEAVTTVETSETEEATQASEVTTGSE